ncbi:hypothetical protein OMR07_22355 [Methylobacterium organophilum]|nr:hypothetical protein [Methylobacterium organophilum]
MKTWLTLPLLVVLLAGCAGKTAYRDSCAAELDAAWKEQSLAEAEGFAGTVSYSKAMALLTGAKIVLDKMVSSGVLSVEATNRNRKYVCKRIL